METIVRTDITRREKISGWHTDSDLMELCNQNRGKVDALKVRKMKDSASLSLLLLLLLLLLLSCGNACNIKPTLLISLVLWCL